MKSGDVADSTKDSVPSQEVAEHFNRGSLSEESFDRIDTKLEKKEPVDECDVELNGFTQGKHGPFTVVSSMISDPKLVDGKSYIHHERNHERKIHKEDNDLCNNSTDLEARNSSDVGKEQNETSGPDNNGTNCYDEMNSEDETENFQNLVFSPNQPLVRPEMSPARIEKEIKRVQGMWELSAILDFVHLFHEQLKLRAFNASDLEKALVTSAGDRGLLADIHIDLMKGISSKSDVKLSNWQVHLANKIRFHWKPLSDGTPCPFKPEKYLEAPSYAVLPAVQRVRALHFLCCIRCDREDIRFCINQAEYLIEGDDFVEIEPKKPNKNQDQVVSTRWTRAKAEEENNRIKERGLDEFRRHPIGEDSEKTQYFLFDMLETCGLRLYRQKTATSVSVANATDENQSANGKHEDTAEGKVLSSHAESSDCSSGIIIEGAYGSRSSYADPSKMSKKSKERALRKMPRVRGKSRLPPPPMAGEWELAADTVENLKREVDRLLLSEDLTDKNLGTFFLDNIVPKWEQHEAAEERRRRTNRRIQSNLGVNDVIDEDGNRRTRRSKTKVNYSYENFDNEVRSAIRRSNKRSAPSMEDDKRSWQEFPSDDIGAGNIESKSGRNTEALDNRLESRNNFKESRGGSQMEVSSTDGANSLRRSQSKDSAENLRHSTGRRSRRGAARPSRFADDFVYGDDIDRQIFRSSTKRSSSPQISNRKSRKSEAANSLPYGRDKKPSDAVDHQPNIGSMEVSGSEFVDHPSHEHQLPKQCAKDLIRNLLINQQRTTSVNESPWVNASQSFPEIPISSRHQSQQILEEQLRNRWSNFMPDINGSNSVASLNNVAHTVGHHMPLNPVGGPEMQTNENFLVQLEQLRALALARQHFVDRQQQILDYQHVQPQEGYTNTLGLRHQYESVPELNPLLQHLNEILYSRANIPSDLDSGVALRESQTMQFNELLHRHMQQQQVQGSSIPIEGDGNNAAAIFASLQEYLSKQGR